MKFKYTGIEEDGVEVSGWMDASDEGAVSSILNSKKICVLEIKKSSDTEESVSSEDGNFLSDFLQGNPKRRDIVFFTKQLAVMLKSGLTLVQSFETLTKVTSNKKFKKIIDDVCNSISRGGDLAASFGRHPQVFSQSYLSMVRIGETSGNLDSSLQGIAEIEEKALKINAKVKAALVYPAILLVMGIGVVGYVVFYIMPKLADVMSRMGAKLPVSTKLMIEGSTFIKENILMIFVVIAISIFLLFKAAISETGKSIIDKHVLKIPVFGKLILMLHTSRFTSTLSGLSKAGIPISKTLEVVTEAESNMYLNGLLAVIRKDVVAGRPLADSMDASGVFPEIAVQMIAAGEASGKLEQMTKDVSNYLEGEVENAVEVMTTLIEPLMLITMGSLVAFIAISAILPIVSITKSVQV